MSGPPEGASSAGGPRPRDGAASDDGGASSSGASGSGGSSAGGRGRGGRPTLQLCPLELRFSQKKMRSVFADGRPIEDAVELVCPVSRPADEAELYDAPWRLEAPFPPIEVLRWRCKLRDETTGRPLLDEAGREVFEESESWFTLDNRRLYCLQKVAARLWPERCTVDVVAEIRKDRRMREIRKFRTLDSGESIMVGSRVDGVPFRRWAWRAYVASSSGGGRGRRGGRGASSSGGKGSGQAGGRGPGSDKGAGRSGRGSPQQGGGARGGNDNGAEADGNSGRGGKHGGRASGGCRGKGGCKGKGFERTAGWSKGCAGKGIDGVGLGTKGTGPVVGGRSKGTGRNGRGHGVGRDVVASDKSAAQPGLVNMGVHVN